MQTRISDEVFADRGGDGADIADMLNHRCERNRHDGDNRGHQQVDVAVADQGEHGVLILDRKTNPGSLRDAGEITRPVTAA